MSISKNLNPMDEAAGVYAYSSEIHECHECQRPTNLIYKTERGTILVCSKECADAFESGAGAEGEL